MPDILNEDGLQLKTLEEIRAELVADLKDIYGNDINVDPNSQDGQQINIFAQAAVDLREILQQINSGFDPDQSFGRVLDQRVAINGITRNGGTYTKTLVEITTDKALNLIGLDDQAEVLNPTVSNLFIVKDDAGTQWYLLLSVSFLTAETKSLEFRAAEIGQVEVQVNTITNPVTIIAGVTNINNPSGPLIIGRNEESDAKLKVRRRASVAIPSTGYLDGIEAALANLTAVTTARVYENNSNVIDPYGTLPHYIWAIVEGGDNNEIAEIIYKKKSSGSGMRGDEIVPVPRPDNREFIAKFDRPGTEDLWIRFSIAIIGGGTVDENYVKEQIVENLIWRIGDNAGADDVIDFLKNLNDRYRVTGMQLSKDDIVYLEVVLISSPKDRFVNDLSRIIIV